MWLSDSTFGYIWTFPLCARDRASSCMIFLHHAICSLSQLVVFTERLETSSNSSAQGCRPLTCPNPHKAKSRSCKQRLWNSAIGKEACRQKRLALGINTSQHRKSIKEHSIGSFQVFFSHGFLLSSQEFPVFCHFAGGLPAFVRNKNRLSVWCVTGVWASPISSYLFLSLPSRYFCSLIRYRVQWYSTLHRDVSKPVLPCVDDAWWYASNVRTGVPSMRCNRRWGKPICETKLTRSFARVIYHCLQSNQQELNEKDRNGAKWSEMDPKESI